MLNARNSPRRHVGTLTIERTSIHMTHLQKEPEFPGISFPIPPSERVSKMLDILPQFTEEDLEKDDKLAYILEK